MLQNIQGLKDLHTRPAGPVGRNVVTAVRTGQSRFARHFVPFEIRLGDEAAISGHVIGQNPTDLPAIEGCSALPGDHP